MIVKRRILTLLLIAFLLASCSNNTSTDSVNDGDGGCINLEIMIKGTIYAHNKTYKIDEVNFAKEGIITSSVNDTEIPYKNNQSNFGKGYEYDIISDQTVYLKYNEDTIYEFLRIN